jgi:hypothetical protein
MELRDSLLFPPFWVLLSMMMKEVMWEWIMYLGTFPGPIYSDRSSCTPTPAPNLSRDLWFKTISRICLMYNLATVKRVWGCRVQWPPGSFFLFIGTIFIFSKDKTLESIFRIACYEALQDFTFRIRFSNNVLQQAAEKRAFIGWSKSIPSLCVLYAHRGETLLLNFFQHFISLNILCSYKFLFDLIPEIRLI